VGVLSSSLSDPGPNSLFMPPWTRTVGALWRRIAAVMVDGLVVGLAGSLIAFPFFDFFSKIGAWGPVFGLFLALPYFAVLNSRWENGQTLGKRLLHLQVVTRQGQPISFGKSFVRYLVLAVPYSLSEMSLPASRTPEGLSWLISMIAMGFGATVYLVLFNRRTRQGLHDLAAGSFVADADECGPMPASSTWWIHYLILGSLFFAVATLGIFENLIYGSGRISQMSDDVERLESIPDVQSANVEDLIWKSAGAPAKKILVVSVTWSGEAAHQDSVADEAAKVLLESDATVKDHDSLRVIVVRGYNLGITRAQVTRTFQRTPAEWRARLPNPSVPS
jgi:uncharacterized RDD family membrane protein YckC